MNDSTQAPVLEVRNLSAGFDTQSCSLRVVEDVSFSIRKGETLGIVGESGCGKSVTCLAVLRLLPKPAGQIYAGEVLLEGQDLLKLKPSKMRRIRGKRIGMIFQEPMTALNPVQKIGKQLAESYHLHFPEMGRKEVREASQDMLAKVGIPSPARRLQEYPHQLSGGIRQRVMIAMALACRPDILIADEPTTALDVTVQAQILELMHQLQEEMGMALIFITHDLGVVAEICDRVMVMYSGKVMEQADVDSIYANPRHPYTRGLLSCIPRIDSEPKTPLPTMAGMVPGNRRHNIRLPVQYALLLSFGDLRHRERGIAGSRSRAFFRLQARATGKT